MADLYLPTRIRAKRHLSLQERESISRGLAQGQGLRTIARLLGRAPSTVSREGARNRGRRCYRAEAAEKTGVACRIAP